MRYRRMPIEVESPEQSGYDTIECNLAESSVTDMLWEEIGADLNGLKLRYGHHVGDPYLRELIAGRHAGIGADDVLLTAGAAAGLFIVSTALLSEKDHLVVQHPNYATNSETPLAIGSRISYAELLFEEQFRLNMDKLADLITPQTRLISVTYPHNPTGAVIGRQQLEQLIALAEQKNTFLLVDETYRDLHFGELPPLAASLSDRVISVSSLSKAYGLPGIRIGWIITRNKELQERFLAAKEQIFVCNPVVDEAVALQFMKRRDEHFVRIRKKVEHNFSILQNWMEKQAFLEWVKPGGGVVCFPRIRNTEQVDVDRFYKVLNEKYRTLTGPGHWFGMDRRYMRIGYGWPPADELSKGLENINLALSLAKK